MKTTVKFLIVFTLMATIISLLSQCNSKQSSENSDTTTVLADSVSDVAEEPADTIEAVAAAEEPADAVDAAVVKEKVIEKQKPLTITIQNLESATAPVYISLYGVKSKFPEPKGQLKEYKFKAHGKELTVKIPDLKFGTYAIASYQDVNSSGEIDKNFIGMPTEGYGFSNNFKPTVKAPKFDDCSFIYSAKENSIAIKMIQ